MQKLAVVYFPKGNLETIDHLRQKYDPLVHLLTPHMTLVSPISEIPENQFVQHVQNSVKDIKPFSIQLNGFIKTEDNLLFLLVREGNEKIIHVHDVLYSGILSLYVPTDYPFTAHVTLGSLNNGDLYTEAEKAHIDIRCKFDSVAIIQGDGISPARIITTILLN